MEYNPEIIKKLEGLAMILPDGIVMIAGRDYTNADVLLQVQSKTKVGEEIYDNLESMWRAERAREKALRGLNV